MCTFYRKLQSKEITEVWESLRQSGTLDNTLKAVSISSPTPNDKSTGIQERSKRDKKRKPGSDKPAEYSPASKKPKVCTILAYAIITSVVSLGSIADYALSDLMEQNVEAVMP